MNPWFEENVSSEWPKIVEKFMKLLQEEEKLQEIVQLVGSDALPEKEQAILEVARLIREYFLQQNAFHEVDTYCEPKKTYRLMKTILHFSDKAEEALERGVAVNPIINTTAKNKIADVKFEKDYETLLNEIEKEMDKEFDSLE